MVIPNHSNSIPAASIRYGQYLHEEGRRAGPDWFVGLLLPRQEREAVERLTGEHLVKFKNQAVYDYLLARTMFYDQLVTDAVRSGIKLVVNIGCGTDTRPFRFEPLLRRNSVGVLECDLPEMVRSKHRHLRRMKTWEYVRGAGIDLEKRRLGNLGKGLAQAPRAATLVMMEGVSPYIDGRAFAYLLDYLSRRLRGPAILAYDFKLKGIDDRFGAARKTSRPFRLGRNKSDLMAFHRSCGWNVTEVCWSQDVVGRFLGRAARGGSADFAEDGFVQATWRQPTARRA